MNLQGSTANVKETSVTLMLSNEDVTCITIFTNTLHGFTSRGKLAQELL